MKHRTYNKNVGKNSLKTEPKLALDFGFDFPFIRNSLRDREAW